MRFLFTRGGGDHTPTVAARADGMVYAAGEAGADDAASGEDGHEVTCAVEAFFQVRDALEARFGPPASAKLDWRPSTSVALDEERAGPLLKLIDALEDNEDVQNVYANFELPESVLQRLSA